MPPTLPPCGGPSRPFVLPSTALSPDDLEDFESERELQLAQEYQDVAAMFRFAVETERRFYLANQVDVRTRSADGEVYFELTLTDDGVWDVYRSARFVKSVRVVTVKDVNIEELSKSDLDVPKPLS